MNASLIPIAGTGPEDLVALPDGRLVVGVQDGRILAFDPQQPHTWQVLANTGGRPLGMECHQHDLIICDSERGLLRLDLRSHRLDVLVRQVGGEALRFCNNATVGEDGTIFFTQSSSRYGLDAWRRDLVDFMPSGRLWKRAPDGQISLIADQLDFANGVTLTHDQSSLIYAQSGAQSLMRYHLRGSAAGRHELFATLAGMPDNLSTDASGLIWVAIASPADARLRLVRKFPPSVRKLSSLIQHHLPIHPKPPVWIQAYSPQGELVRQLRFEHPQFCMSTGVRRVNHQLYIGSLVGQHILQLTLMG